MPSPSLRRASVRSLSFLLVLLLGTGAVVSACAGSGRDPFLSTTDEVASIEPVAPDASPPPPPAPEAPKPASDGGDEADPCKRAPPSLLCGVAPQCGCSPTETCDVANTLGEAACVTAGKAAMGWPCTATAGCSRGLTCIFGTCHAFCGSPGTACGIAGTGACLQVTTQSGTDVPNLAVCLIACAPHDPTSCGGETNAGTGACVVDSNGATDCQTGGARKEDESCSPTDPCGPALVCTTRGDKSTCERWCRVGQNDCGTDKTCGGFQPEVKVGGVAYGACP